MNEFENKVVLITGATGGFGKCVAKEFAAKGAKLSLVDINEEGLKNIKESLGTSAENVLTIRADVTKEAEVIKYVEETEKAFGTIDIFFNNAGVLNLGYIKDIKEEDFDKVWNVNVKGVLFGLKHVIRVMEKHGGGSIIDTASIDSFNTDPMYGAYSASKHACLALTKIAALEEVSHNIRINAVCPGPAATEMVRTLASQETPDNPEKTMERFASNIPMHRLAEPIDVANAVLFLASEKSAYITGTKIVIDGGYKHE